MSEQNENVAKKQAQIAMRSIQPSAQSIVGGLALEFVGSLAMVIGLFTAETSRYGNLRPNAFLVLGGITVIFGTIVFLFGLYYALRNHEIFTRFQMAKHL